MRRGRIDRLAVGAAELRDVQGESAGPDDLKLRRENLNARFPDGNAIEHLHFAWRNESSPRFSGVARLTVRDDFASVRSGVAQLVEQKHDALSARPFRATSAVRAITPPFTLGVGVEGCCEAQLPRPELESIQGGFTAAADATQGFQRWCANCHRSNDRFPPNFLAGNASEVQAKLKHCAERIYVRLAMHEVVEKDRPKTPMPPATARERLGAAEINTLRDYAAGLIKAQRGTLPALNELLFSGYEGLRACLPS